LTLTEPDGAVWRAKADLLASGAGDRDVVVEVDNDGIAHLRFGDGELGQQPAVGITLDASYRVGNGARGNVGAESIASIVFTSGVLDGIEFTIRNPLAATGGVDPESIELAKLHAPAAFRAKLLRAITAADYAKLALSDPGLQRAFATLVWTGSWNEAVVSVDPLQSETIDDERLAAIEAMLHRYRRIGHDLRVRAAVYVPIALSLEVCAKPGYDHGHVKAALLARFVGAGGFFSPDRLSFGDGVHLSRIVAEAIGVAGVEHVSVTALRRLFAAPNGEIENGVLPLAAHEIAQLDDDPNHPERGALAIVVRGGR
jgi:predicted phage baseplate assembly protein